MLAAILKNDGYSVKQLDLNSDFITWYLNSKHVSRAMTKIRRRCNSLENKNYLKETQYNEYIRIENLENIFSTIRDSKGDINKNVSAFLSMLGIDVPIPVLRSDIVAMANSRVEGLNLIREFYRETIGLMGTVRPLFIGISVVSPPQVIPAIILTSMIRRHMWKDVKVFWGGPLMSLLDDKSLKTILDNVRIDGIVKGEGEESILEIAAQLKKGNFQNNTIPNLVFMQRGRVALSAIVPKIHISQYPLPFYNSTDLRKYRKITPISVLLSRGCKWGKCAFCEYPRLYRRKQLKSPEQAVEDINQLVTRYPGHHLWISCDMMDASYLRRLCCIIIKEKIRANWKTYMRVDTRFSTEDLKLMKKAGCFMAVIGLDSLDSVVLKKINKGYTADQAVRFLQRLGESELDAQINMIANLPYTTYQSALQQFDILGSVLSCSAMKGVYRLVSIDHLQVSKNAPMGICPDKYGIRLLVKDGGGKSNYINYMPYVDDRWMSHDECADILDKYSNLNLELMMLRSGDSRKFKKIRQSDVLDYDNIHILLHDHAFDPSVVKGHHARTSDEFVKVYNMRTGIQMIMPRATIVYWVLNELPMRLSDLKDTFKKETSSSIHPDDSELYDVLEDMVTIGAINVQHT
jgi:radical SAM superfamily enzyme YgiQ (UPF0313 family)